MASLVGGNCVIVVMFATRHSVLVYMLGIAFDRAILFHRWLGRWNTILVLGHVIIEAVLHFTVGTGNTDLENIYGLVSVIAFLLVLIFSLEWFRRAQFELFLVSHLLVIVFFVLGVLHNNGFLLYTILSAILIGLDWILRLALGSVVVPSKTTLFKKRAENLVQVRFTKNSPWAKKLYGPGQYVFLNFPAISHTEWHPFSVTSSPDDPEIEVNIRALGNWTKKVYQLASAEDCVWVRADGPYGNLNLDYHRYSNMVLVAGGIGITPVIGILKEIFAGKKRRSRIQSVVMVWSVPSEIEAGWFMEELKALYQISNSSSIKLEIKVHLSKAKEVPPSPFLNTGRPDIEKYLDGATQERTPCFVFVCGPKKLVNSAWDISTKLQRKGKICHFHHETFQF
uniref:FAD-binding FR-type domain-containing protein n=1 Tax=Arcella intermedia TaxID=1963864 RepID=A0A6B2L6A5_9EUKA